MVASLDRQPDDPALCEAVITAAHQFGMSAVAEDMETEEEAAALRALGVDDLQGYLPGRPNPRSESAPDATDGSTNASAKAPASAHRSPAHPAGPAIPAGLPRCRPPP